MLLPVWAPPGSTLTWVLPSLSPLYVAERQQCKCAKATFSCCENHSWMGTGLRPVLICRVIPVPEGFRHLGPQTLILKAASRERQDEEKQIVASLCRCSMIIHLQRKALQKIGVSQTSFRFLDKFPLELSPAQSSLSSTLNMSHTHTYRTTYR